MNRAREGLRLKVYNTLSVHFGYAPVDRTVVAHSNERGVVRLRTLTDSILADFENYAGKPVELLAAPKNREPESLEDRVIRQTRQAIGLAPDLTLPKWRGQTDPSELPEPAPNFEWFILDAPEGKYLVQRCLMHRNGFSAPVLETGETYHRSVSQRLHTIRRI